MADNIKRNGKDNDVPEFLQFSKPKQVICPNCGKKLNPVGGVMIPKCPFCKADLPSEAK